MNVSRSALFHMKTRVFMLVTYDDRYIKARIRTCGGNVYTNFCGLTMLEDGVEWESFAINFTDSLFVFDNKFYLQVYIDSYAYKFMDKQMRDYLDGNLFENDED